MNDEIEQKAREIANAWDISPDQVPDYKDITGLREWIFEAAFEALQQSRKEVDRLRVENVKLYGWMDGSEQWYKRETDKDKAERQKLKAKCAELEEIVGKFRAFLLDLRDDYRHSDEVHKRITWLLDQLLNDKASKEV